LVFRDIFGRLMDFKREKIGLYDPAFEHDACGVGFVARIDGQATHQVLELALDPADGSGLSWLYRHTEVLEKEMSGDGRLHVRVRGSAEQAARVRAKFEEVVG